VIFHNRLLQATINSLLVHLFFFGMLHLLSQRAPLSPTQNLIDKAINVETISPQQMKKYRTVGVRGGSKKFSMKTPQGNGAKKNEGKGPLRMQMPDQKNSGTKSAKAQDNLSLSSLQAKVSEKDLPPPPEDPRQKFKRDQERAAKKEMSPEQKRILIKKEIQAAEAGVPLTALRSNQAVENFKRQEAIRRNLMSEMGTQSSRAEVLKRTGFNLHFEPPEGVSEDELNSVEKIFYSFQKRTFTTYVQSFLSTYQQKIINKPQLRNALSTEKHLLTGKIDFDKEGNIIRIKILRSSQSDEVHELFEETLKGINSLPNPPKDLVEKRDQFTIYYQLHINY
jgi:hypothetical protein